MIDETYPISIYKESLKKNGYAIIPNVYNNDEINEEEFDDVSFVPMLAGKSEDGIDV